MPRPSGSACSTFSRVLTIVACPLDRLPVIAFFKVESDGFDLGAQRRPIDKNDLPQVQSEIADYLRLLRTRETLEDFQPMMGLLVEKEKIAANGDYNLSGERYRPIATYISSYPMVPIGEICDLINGRAFKPEDWEDSDSGGLPIVRIQNLNTPDSGFNYYTGEVRDRYILNRRQLLFRRGPVHEEPRLERIFGMVERLYSTSTSSRSVLIKLGQSRCMCSTP